MARYNARHDSLSPRSLSLGEVRDTGWTGVARGPTPRRIAARQPTERKHQKKGKGLFFYLISEMYEAQRSTPSSSRLFKDASPPPLVSSFIAISRFLCRFARRAGLIPLPDRPDARSFTPLGWDNASPVTVQPSFDPA